ncbi:MAG: DNA primase [Rhodospirillaceae bacterium]|nr:DNA primase [Rhodospirillaceae bacterium]MCY4239487.1 DNA primase [Rhodospirillaceae bacterium]
MTITPQFLDELRARLPVSDVVGKRVKLVKKGREFSGLCPFHDEKTPSFTVNDDKAFYHCFGCGAHGDVIRFVIETEGLSFPEAVEKLGAIAGLQVPKATPQERQRADRARSLQEASEAAARFYERHLRDHNGAAALDYLRRRGLKQETIQQFRLGWAPDRRMALKQAMIGEGYPEALLIEAGLLIKPEGGGETLDRFYNRLMFPISDRRGRAIAFGGRALGDIKPKYINSPETPLFNKGHLLYAMDTAREAARDGADVIVTEGYTDVIALWQAGFRGATAPLGTALTESQLAELWRLAPEPVLCFDGDQAGRRAAARAVGRALPRLQPGLSLRFAILPSGEDPDSLIATEGPPAFRRLLEGALPLVDCLWQLETAGRPSDTPERRTAILKALRNRIAEIGERSVQDAYFDEIEVRFRKAFGRVPSNRSGYGGQGRKARFRYDRFSRSANTPAGAVKTDGRVDSLHLRGRQALLATLINHPALFDTLAEELAKTPFSEGSDLDRLRGFLLEGNGATEADALETAGLVATVDRVTSRAVYELAPFAAPSARDDEALEGWRHLYRQMFETRALNAEKAAAMQAFADAPDERRWAYLRALGAQARPSDEEELGRDG